MTVPTTHKYRIQKRYNFGDRCDGIREEVGTTNIAELIETLKVAKAKKTRICVELKPQSKYSRGSASKKGYVLAVNDYTEKQSVAIVSTLNSAKYGNYGFEYISSVKITKKPHTVLWEAKELDVGPEITAARALKPYPQDQSLIRLRAHKIIARYLTSDEYQPKKFKFVSTDTRDIDLDAVEDVFAILEYGNTIWDTLMGRTLVPMPFPVDKTPFSDLKKLAETNVKIMATTIATEANCALDGFEAQELSVSMQENINATILLTARANIELKPDGTTSNPFGDVLDTTKLSPGDNDGLLGAVGIDTITGCALYFGREEAPRPRAPELAYLSEKDANEAMEHHMLVSDVESTYLPLKKRPHQITQTSCAPRKGGLFLHRKPNAYRGTKQAQEDGVSRAVDLYNKWLAFEDGTGPTETTPKLIDVIWNQGILGKAETEIPDNLVEQVTADHITELMRQDGIGNPREGTCLDCVSGRTRVQRRIAEEAEKAAEQSA